jgi:hypothetical protein
MGFSRALRISALVVVALASCTLTTDLDGFSGGEDTPADAGGEASNEDRSNPPPPPPAPPGDDGGADDVKVDVIDACDQTGCFDMPVGFSLVAFSQSTRPGCPTNFTLPTDTVESPAFGPGACSCSCNVTTNPTCSLGKLFGHYDTGGGLTCANVGGDLLNTNNMCGTDGFLGPFDVGNEHRFAPPGLSGGTCSASASANQAKLSFGSSGRACKASVLPECNGKVCPPSLATPFKSCIAHTGDVACPAPFTTKHLVGSAGTLACSNPCACSGVTGTCNGGTLNYYNSGDCSGAAALSIPVDDACHATDLAGASVGSHKYIANAPSGIGCTKNGSPTPSVSYTGQQTICCN